jgi:hypothetical protein
MKSFLILLAILLAVPYVKAADIECRTERQWLGIYYQECPIGAVMTGARARIIGSFVYTDVECERHTTVCEEKVSEPVDTETKPDYNSEL